VEHMPRLCWKICAFVAKICGDYAIFEYNQVGVSSI
jgi:hypothetical protein